MGKKRLLLCLVVVVVLAAGLGGCATLRSPVTSQQDHPIDYSQDTALRLGLTYEYNRQDDKKVNLDGYEKKYYLYAYSAACDDGGPCSTESRTTVRNRIIHELIGVVDENFHQYERKLRHDRDNKDVITKTLSIITTTVGAFTPTGTTQILSGVDTAFKGFSETIDTTMFHSLSTEALINQMRKNRAVILQGIYGRMQICLDKEYPLQAAIGDLIRYYNEGSVTSALVSLAGDTASSANVAIDKANRAKSGLPPKPEAGDPAAAAPANIPTGGQAPRN